MTAPSPERAVVFQTYALLPWLTAFENVYLAVDQVFAKYSQEQKRQHTERYLAMVGLSAAHSRASPSPPKACPPPQRMTSVCACVKAVSCVNGRGWERQ